MSDQQSLCTNEMIQEHTETLTRLDLTIFGNNGDPGIVKKVNTLYEWFLTSRGKNSVIMFIKDALISGGIVAIFVNWWLT